MSKFDKLENFCFMTCSNMFDSPPLQYWQSRITCFRLFIHGLTSLWCSILLMLISLNTIHCLKWQLLINGSRKKGFICNFLKKNIMVFQISPQTFSIFEQGTKKKVNRLIIFHKFHSLISNF